jgi:hypothetical protein
MAAPLIGCCLWACLLSRRGFGTTSYFKFNRRFNGDKKEAQEKTCYCFGKCLYTPISKEINFMQNWHWGIIIAFLVGYLVGCKWPATGNSALSKVGF